MSDFEQGAEYGGEPGYEPGSGGPDITDGLAQRNAAFQPGDEVPAYQGGGYGDEQFHEADGYGSEGYYGKQGHEPDSPVHVLNELVDGRVHEQMQPMLEAIEGERRAGAILGLAEQYPGMRDPQVLAEVAGELDNLAAEYGDPSIRTDPYFVEQAYLAHEARRHFAQVRAEEGARQPSPRSEMVLETGSGPGVAPSRMDPIEAAYTKAMVGEKTDAYGYPLP